MPNIYEHLNLGAVEDAREQMPVSEVAISKHPAETIRIFTARFGKDIIYGYQVIWKSGQNSYRNPTARLGRFRTETDARLHCIGFFKAFREHFQPESFANIIAAETKYLKPVLPFD